MASLDEQLAAVERKAAQIRERKRKRETRIKVLKGVAFDLLPHDQQLALLDQAITAKKDRQLLGLDPEPKPEPEPEPAQAQQQRFMPPDV